MRGANRQPRRAAIDQIEIDEFAERLFERLGGIVSGPVGAKRIVVAGMGQRIRSEKPRNAVCHRRPVRQFFIEAGKYIAETPDWILLHPLPEFLQPQQAILRRVTGDQTGIDGADRCPDDPVRLNPGLVQRLIDACLIRSQRAAALKHQHDLTGKRPAQWPEALPSSVIPYIVHVTLPLDACRVLSGSRDPG